MPTIKTVVAAILCTGLPLAGGAPVRAAQFAFHCVNSASGAGVTFSVDDRLRTVNGIPAEITDDHIAWQDKSGGGSYDLHRISGNVTVTTGGHKRFDRCQSK